MKLCKDCKYIGLWFTELNQECRHPNVIEYYDYINNNHIYKNCNDFRRETSINGGCGFRAKYFEPKQMKIKEFFKKRIGRPAR